jgi:hypothetical protein
MARLALSDSRSWPSPSKVTLEVQTPPIPGLPLIAQITYLACCAHYPRRIRTGARVGSFPGLVARTLRPMSTAGATRQERLYDIALTPLSELQAV